MNRMVILIGSFFLVAKICLAGHWPPGAECEPSGINDPCCDRNWHFKNDPGCNQISLNTQAGFLLQCDKACQSCPYFCSCSETEQKFSCGKEPNSVETFDGQGVESNQLIAGADPCSLCAKDPKKWQAACEMCYGDRVQIGANSDSIYGAICCSDACQGVVDYYACYDRCVKSPMGLGC